MSVSKVRPISLYIHWPFCLTKCPYCDFFSLVKSFDDDLTSLKNAYERDLRNQAALLLRSDQLFSKSRKLVSIFFGGGTPSLMPPDLVKHIIHIAKDLWLFDDTLEISLEANPTSSHQNLFESLKDAGVNRLSIGVQSLREDVLQFLGRDHNPLDAVHTIQQAKSIFQNKVSWDMIYTRPASAYSLSFLPSSQELMNLWKEELEYALSLDPKHLSLYQLTIEKGTLFHTQYKRGDFHMLDANISADLYNMTSDILGKHGLYGYEISNYAASSIYECQHNLTYWRYQEYMGIGPGAHGRLQLALHDQNPIMLAPIMTATEHPRQLDTWLTDTPLPKQTILDEKTQFEEYLMMSLRLKEGADMNRYPQYMHKILESHQWQYLIQEGYIEIKNSQGEGHIALTQEGILRHQGIASYLLSNL